MKLEDLYSCQPSEKVIEFKKEQRKALPFTVEDIGDKLALTAFRLDSFVKAEIERERRKIAWAVKREVLAGKFYAACRGMLTVSSEAEVAARSQNECECGAGAVNSERHSSWCPTTTYQFKRNKTSDNRSS